MERRFIGFMEKRKQNRLLHYFLHDIFEMHLSQDADIINQVIQRLLQIPFNTYSIGHVFSFEIDDALVMIRKDAQHHLKRLLVLDPEELTFKASQVIHERKGRYNV